MSDAKQPTAETPSEKISVACGGCGRPILDGGRFCAKCGRPVGKSGTAGVSDKGSAGDLVWQVNVPLITNRFVLLDVIMGGWRSC